MIRRLLTAEAARCTGCRICEFVCSLHKTGELNPYRARLKIAPRSELGAFVPVICRHCVKPACFAACPMPGAMSRDLQTGVVRIIEAACIGCRECVVACPFGALQLTPEGEPLKCDLCGGEPRCVRHCPARPLPDGSAPSALEQSCLQYREFSRVGKKSLRLW